MSKKTSTYALFKNQDGTFSCYRHSFCSTNEKGEPTFYCDNSENKGKEACKNISTSGFQGCFRDSNCSRKDSVFSPVTPKSPSSGNSKTKSSSSCTIL